MNFDFDTVIDRRAWHSIKWDKYRDLDTLPLWIADMDYPTPEFIVQAIRNRLEHPILGCSSVPDDLNETFVEWGAKKFNWQINVDWLVWMHSVMTGVDIAVRVIGKRGDQCVIPVPTYPPFLAVPERQDRVPLFSPLLQWDGRWEMDFDDIRRTTATAPTFLFSNPQNPTGRVYNPQELIELAATCIHNDTILISDDVHWGLVLEEELAYTPIASLDPEIAEKTISLFSHTKTYNVAGASAAVAVIPDPALRQTFKSQAIRIHPTISPLAFAGATAAYGDESTWLDELNSYLRQNRDLLQQAIENSQLLQTTNVEGTHLMWIDATRLPVSSPQQHFESFGLGLSDGAEFQGPGFVRLNFAIPRSLLDKCLEKLLEACTPFI